MQRHTKQWKINSSKCQNTIFEQAKFNQQKQEEGEPVDYFITNLYCLAKHYGYGDLQDELVRDHIVIGIWDRKLSKKLQLEKKPMLEEAITKVCQSEVIRKQQSITKADGQDEMTVEVIKANRTCKYPQHRGKSRQIKPTKSGICTRCGWSSQCGRQLTCQRCRMPQMRQERALPKHVQKQGRQTGDCGQWWRIPGCNHTHSCYCEV